MALVFMSHLSANPTGMSIIIPISFVLLVHLSSLSMSLCLSLTTLFIQCVRLATLLKDKQTARPRDKGLTARTHVTENLFTVFPQKRERGGRRGQWEEGCDVYSEIVTSTQKRLHDTQAKSGVNGLFSQAFTS